MERGMDGDAGIDFLSRRVVTLRAVTWGGPLPGPGDYLRTERGLTAYQIVSVHPNMRKDPRSRARFRCWKVPAGQVPEGARVHAWEWSPRG